MSSKVYLVISPHGYDATLFCGGTIAHLLEEGHAVHVVRVLDDAKKACTGTLEQARARSECESEMAIRTLGNPGLTHLGYPEDGISLADWHSLREKIVRLIRQLKPFVVMSFDPWALYDEEYEHLLVARIVEDACRCSAGHLFHSEHMDAGLLPHSVAQRIYFGRSLSRINHVVDISSQIEVKVNAMMQHKQALCFLVEGFLNRLRANRLRLPLMDDTGDAQEIHAHLMEQFIRRNASEVGRSAGLRCGEGFRLDRFGELDDFVEAVAEPVRSDEED